MARPVLRYLVVILIQLLGITTMAQDGRAKIDSLIAIPYDVIVSEPNRAIVQFQNGIVASQKINYKFGTAKLFSHLALAYSSISKFDEYRDSQIKAIKLFEEMNDELELTSAYGSFGYRLRRTNLKLSKHYMLLAIKIGEKNNLLSDLCAIYDNYGIVLEFSNELDSALYYYKKGLNLKNDLADTIGIPYSLNHIAGIYAVKGDIDEAFKYMAKSDEYRNKEKSNYGRAENAVITGELYAMAGKHDLAILKFNESLELAKQIGNKYMTQYNYEKLSEMYQQKGDYKDAYLNLKNHKNYQDSILNTETNHKIAELEIKFETEKKDKEISASRFKLKEQRGQIIFVASISIILLLVSIGIYRFQTYKKKQIRKELELKHQLTKAEYENKINDEKIRISRELHDNIGSNLTFIISSIDNLTYRSKDEKYISTLSKLSNFGRSTLNELRQTIWAMKNNESNLKQFALKLAELKKQILANIEIQISNKVNSEIVLSSTQTLNLFRVVQEAIQNTIKYAEANRIDILFTETNNGIKLTIKDDGNGFDISTVKLGNGINNMKHRCNEVGGDFTINSSGNGTEIICNIKIN